MMKLAPPGGSVGSNFSRPVRVLLPLPPVLLPPLLPLVAVGVASGSRVPAVLRLSVFFAPLSSSSSLLLLSSLLGALVSLGFSAMC